MNKQTLAATIGANVSTKGLTLVPAAMKSIARKKSARIAGTTSAAMLKKIRTDAAAQDRRIQATIDTGKFRIGMETMHEILRVADDEIIKNKHVFTFNVLRRLQWDRVEINMLPMKPDLQTIHKLIKMHSKVNGFSVTVAGRGRPKKVQ